MEMNTEFMKAKKKMPTKKKAKICREKTAASQEKYILDFSVFFILITLKLSKYKL